MRQMDIGEAIIALAPRFCGAFDVAITEGAMALP
jgi:hypothetical protein